MRDGILSIFDIKLKFYILSKIDQKNLFWSILLQGDILPIYSCIKKIDTVLFLLLVGVYLYSLVKISNQLV